MPMRCIRHGAAKAGGCNSGRTDPVAPVRWLDPRVGEVLAGKRRDGCCRLSLRQIRRGPQNARYGQGRCPDLHFGPSSHEARCAVAHANRGRPGKAGRDVGAGWVGQGAFADGDDLSARFPRLRGAEHSVGPLGRHPATAGACLLQGRTGQSRLEGGDRGDCAANFRQTRLAGHCLVLTPTGTAPVSDQRQGKYSC